MKGYIQTCLLALAAVALGQGLSDLPDCAKSCASELPKECVLADIKCYCSSSSWIQTLSCCVRNSCADVDQSKTIQLASNLCKLVGVTVPTVASCAGASSTASSSAAAASSSSATTGSITGAQTATTASRSSSSSAAAASATGTSSRSATSATGSATSASSAAASAASATSSPGAAAGHFIGQGLSAAGAAAFVFALL